MPKWGGGGGPGPVLAGIEGLQQGRGGSWPSHVDLEAR